MDEKLKILIEETDSILKGGPGSGSWNGPNSPRFAHRGKPKKEEEVGAGNAKKTRGHIYILPPSETKKIRQISEDLNISMSEARKYYRAIKGYCTTEDYRAIRRGEKKDKAGRLEDYTSKAPSWDGSGKVYRGMHIQETLLSQLKRGTSFDLAGLSSWSNLENIAKSFAKKKAKGKSKPVVLISNKMDSGVSLTHLSKYVGEREVLVSGKTIFKVSGIREKKGITYITVEER